MSRSMLQRLTTAAAAIAFGASAAPAGAEPPVPDESAVRFGYFPLDDQITVRRIVLRASRPKGVVLLLHGFPETVYAWEGVAQQLAGEFEVHAFDWPGYGLSSRPPAGRFGYTPRDYARVLKSYVEKAGIDRSRLVIYATDIGALPALLAALEKPDIARRIIVGDFAPFDRPELMYESLRALKTPASAGLVRDHMNRTRDEILENTTRRGLSADEQFALSPVFKADMAWGWSRGPMSSADAFYHYYSGFTRDQDHLEANIGRVETPVTVMWGEKDLYIDKAMGAEFAERIGAGLSLLPGIGHYPHLQAPALAAEEIRAAFR